MFVEAGLGQLGANGQLLSPHFGSRARLMMITTDAPVTYDEPVDYGIQRFCQECQVCVNRCPGRALVRDKVWWRGVDYGIQRFCQECQVCVNRCPGRALVRDKVWWRGVEKNKLIYERCRPVMARYDGCGVCMKVCPVQRYGMKPVMEHYVATGEVLGKGTDNLEGYTFMEKGYFGPGELPQFDHDFFEFPHGTREDWLFERFKERLAKNGVPAADDLAKFAEDVKTVLDRGPTTRGDE
jgi:NAD-dependent dihydropyrimidine dehydrogenase PreA subunit